MADGTLDRDEQKLAELGYKQELDRGWSRFSNFAISFTIISVLAGCFTTYPQAWNLGGPIAISWGWPIVCLIVLTVAFSMAEVASAYPDRRRALLVGERARRPGLVVVHGLVQPARADRHRGHGRLVLRPVLHATCSTSGASTSS